MKKKKKKKRRRRQSAEELLGPACCAQATVQAASSRVADGRTGGRADKQARNATPRLVSSPTAPVSGIERPCSRLPGPRLFPCLRSPGTGSRADVTGEGG
jgi:hypothetical protein